MRTKARTKLEQDANQGHQRDVWANIRVPSKKQKNVRQLFAIKTETSLKAAEDKLPPANFFADLLRTPLTLKEIFCQN